jgi:uncharacterized protein (DUF1501 family)
MERRQLPNLSCRTGPLTRRDLLKKGLTVGAIGAASLALPEPLALLLDRAAADPLPAGTGVLVVVTLYGGNDGLNTVIPVADPAYAAARGALAYGPAATLPLGQGFGLHPALVELKGLWDDGHLAVVRGVGYPNPVRSHFRAQDIWQTGVPETVVTTGWLGRWLDGAARRDPLAAVAVGGTVPRMLVGDHSAAVAVPNGPFTIPGGDRFVSAFRATNAVAAQTSPLARQVAQSGTDLLDASATIATIEQAASNSGRGTGLAKQLDLVATLIKGGAPARAYGVSLGGFDTHAAQKATHARVLAQLDTAVGQFFQSLAGDPRGAAVTLMVHSEFGRRVATNASGGTDHGTAAPVLVAGPPVKGGFYGAQPSLVQLDQGDLRFTTDFRSVYATLLQKVLGADPSAVLTGGPFPLLPLL